MQARQSEKFLKMKKENPGFEREVVRHLLGLSKSNNFCIKTLKEKLEKENG